MATGVIVLCLGAYTRLSSFVTSSNKQYRAVIRLGATTDTLDADGTVANRNVSGCVGQSQVDAALADFTGKIAQIPPMYSAIRMEGRRLYELARKGIEVERVPREVEIFSLEQIAYSWPLLHVNVCCSKGTYIRTLADDIGQKLGCGGFLATLRRTTVGYVGLDRCLTMQNLRSLEAPGSLSETTIDQHTVLQDVPAVLLTPDQWGPFSNGNAVSDVSNMSTGTVRVLNQDDELLGIGQMERGVLKPQRVIQNR